MRNSRGTNAFKIKGGYDRNGLYVIISPSTLHCSVNVVVSVSPTQTVYLQMAYIKLCCSYMHIKGFTDVFVNIHMW